MQNLKNKMMFKLSILIMMVALLTLSYYTYLSYQKYTTVQKSTKLSSFLSELESVLYKIESERINSVIYLVSQRKNNLDKLKETRVAVDLTLTQLDTFLKQSAGYEIYSKEITQIDTELKQVRKKIDSVNNDSRNILFQDYHSKIVGSLLEILKEISLSQKFEPVKSYLSMYEEYTKLKENSILEIIFLLFMDIVCNLRFVICYFLFIRIRSESRIIFERQSPVVHRIQRGPDGTGQLRVFGDQYFMAGHLFGHFNQIGVVGHDTAGQDHIFGHGIHFQDSSDDREKYTLDDVFDLFTVSNILQDLGG